VTGSPTTFSTSAHRLAHRSPTERRLPVLGCGRYPPIRARDPKTERRARTTRGPRVSTHVSVLAHSGTTAQIAGYVRFGSARSVSVMCTGCGIYRRCPRRGRLSCVSGDTTTYAKRSLDKITKLQKSCPCDVRYTRVSTGASAFGDRGRVRLTDAGCPDRAVDLTLCTSRGCGQARRWPQSRSPTAAPPPTSRWRGSLPCSTA
jgi:hypothetical protein